MKISTSAVNFRRLSGRSLQIAAKRLAVLRRENLKIFDCTMVCGGSEHFHYIYRDRP
jgi:hypothetical protein